jgi:eukaryotic-like serine/threonine-protein kinase
VSHNYTSPANGSLLTYQNKSILGVSIQYPFNWKRIEADGKAVIFLPPSRKDGFAEKLTVAVFNVNSSMSPSQFSSSAINNYAEQYRDFFIIDSKPLTMLGDPAYTLSYTYNDPGAGQISAMDVGVKDGNKAYIISYSAQQPEYHIYVPAIEKMIQSFHIISTPVPITF